MKKQQSSRIILGIDPGTQITGYGIIKATGASYTAVDYGCIRPPANKKLSERYYIISRALGEIMKIHTPDAVVVETQYVAKNPQSSLKLAMVRGVVIVTSTHENITVYEYAPSAAKKAVVGKGNASKGQVQLMVQLLLNLDAIPTPHDAADALALAICHAHTLYYHNPAAMEL